MTLTAAIAASFAVTAALVYWAWRHPGRFPRAATLVVVLVPFFLLTAVLRGRPETHDGDSLQVVGQYAFLLDTLRIGAGPDADVRIPAPSTGRGGTGLVAVHFRSDDSSIVVKAGPGSPPVVTDGYVLAAGAVGRGATIVLARPNQAPVTLRIEMPWWPLGCTTRLASLCGERVVRAGSVTARVRVPERGVWNDAADPALSRFPSFVLFRRDGRVYVAAGSRATITVNGAAPPTEARSVSGALEIGLGRATSRLRAVADRRANRLKILFSGRLVGDRWPLHGGDERAVHRVSYGTPPSPGTLPVIDLSGTPLGTNGASYSGALEWTGERWRWHADGGMRSISVGETVLLPGTGSARTERGHLVRLTTNAAALGSLASIAIVWAIAALLLASGAGAATGAVPALRLGVLGLAYTLAMVRSVIAIRVATAEPFNLEAVPTTLVFLIAFPVLVWLLERMREWDWRRVLDGTGIAGWRRLTAQVGVVAGAAVATYLLAGGIDRALFVVFIILTGTVGLLVLQSLLVPREALSSAGTPLGMFEIGSERGFSGRHLMRAVSTLLVLVVLYIALALSLRGVPPYLSMAAYTVVLVFIYAAAETRGRVWPRIAAARHALIVRVVGVVAAVAAGLGAVAVLGFRVAPVIAATLAGGIAGVLAVRFVLAPLVGPVRLWPYRRRDVLPPAWFAFAPVALLLVSQWSAVRRLGITLGFALAVAGLLLVVRVFAVLWHRETKERVDAHLRGTTPGNETRRRTPVFVLLALTVYAGYLGADRGLMLLLVTSVLATLVMATAMLGPKRMAAAALALLVTLGSIGAWLRVSPTELATRPMSLATPQVRFAAVRYPRALERQLLVAKAGPAREIVSTLQQDWGMRAYAAAGGTWGNGLYGTAYTRRAISEDVALTDNAFAVFVLSEHGFAGGSALLSVYLALALLLLASAMIAGRSVNEVPRGILLGGLAMYVAVPALYMAAANVSLLPLTGQNLPLLGLRSGADVAFASWTLALAIVALPRAGGAARGVTERAELNSLAMMRLAAILGAAAVVLVVVGMGVMRSLYRATHREVAPFQLAAFADGLRSAVERADIVARGDSIVAGAAARGKLGFRDGDFLRATIERANAFAANRAEYRSHCVERAAWLRADDDGVQVSDAPCKVEAPVGGGGPWTGRLLAAAQPVSADSSARAGVVIDVPSDVVLAGGGSAVVLSSDGAAVARVSCRDTVIAFAAVADVGCVRDAHVRARRTGKGAVVEVVSPGVGVTKNGNPVASGERLRFGDVIAIDSAATWIVDAAPRGALAYARERNGQSVRSVMPATPAIFARLDSLLSDGLLLRTRDAASDVMLTIDRAAIADVQRGLDRRCAEAASGGVRQCSAMLVDPETGDILVIASWAKPGLRVSRFAPLDHNFRNHRAASTVKPFIAAAVLSEYPSLSSLVVDHPTERFGSAAGWPLGTATPMKSELHGCPRTPITWDCFLPTSNNLYAVTLGFLGAAERGANGLPALGGAVEGPGYSIGGRRMSQRPRFEVRNGRRVVAASPLARQLETLFDARIGAPAGVFDESLWRPLTKRKLLRTNPQWQLVSPDVPSLPLDAPRFSDLRYLAGFMIGENENNWSNAALVRALARVMTGRGTELRLIQRVGDTVLAPIEKPGVRFGRARADVLSGMRGVVRGYGTAARTTGALFNTPGFDFFGKTGTLESQRFEPLSLFLFGGHDARPKPHACPVVGIVYVESERGAAERLSGVSLFADVIAPVLRERYGWADKPCLVARPTGETP